MVHGVRAELLAELSRLKVRVKTLRKANMELDAMAAQVIEENKQLKQLIRERLEETQMLRGILG
jgi:hypothetical protein